jgi:hypothetical protein
MIAKKIDLRIFKDLHVLSPIRCKKKISVILLVCIYVCLARTCVVVQIDFIHIQYSRVYLP